MQKEQFDITGMTCSACSTRVEKSVAKLPGIKEVSVNLLKNSMVASYDESVLDTAGIVQAVEKVGYGAIPKASAQNKSHTTTPATTGGQYGAGRIQADETAAAAFCPVYNPAVLYFYGSHDGVAVPQLLAGDGKRNQLCIYSIPAADPGGVHQLQILPDGLQDPVPRLA